MTEQYPALAPRDLLILATLAEQSCHGYGLIKQVEARQDSGITLDPANLYRVLRRMRKSEWVDEGVADQVSAGSTDKRRRVYTITKIGREVLEAELARLERLLQQARPALAGGRD